MWPGENWRAFTLFERLRTQWTVSMAGPVGLRYEVALPMIDRMKLPEEEADQLFEDLRTMEAAALKAMGEG